MRKLKEQIDRWAINLAAKSLSAGVFDPARAANAAELLRNPELLQPVEATAQFQLSSGKDFSFTSTVATASPRNNTVHGKFYRAADPWQTRPLVILVHGWNAELHYLYVMPRLARALNERGFNAALIELPYHLHRRPPRSAGGMHDFISDDLPGMLLATRQAISDLHALARWARAQGCPSVAVWGFSLGAWLAGLYTCQSNVLSAAILTTPVSDLTRAVQELSFCHPIRAGIAGTVVDLSPLKLASHRPQIPADAIYLSESEYDLFVPPETYQEVAAAWKLPGWDRVRHSHLSVLVSRKAMRATLDWLAARNG